MTEKKHFELWYSQAGGYTFFECSQEDVRAQLEHDAELIWEVDASSWEEAQAEKHKYLGWEPYRPIEQ